MGREVRRVPADWQHPRNEKGYYIPLLGGSFSEEARKWDVAAAKWAEGLCDDGNGGWKAIDPEYAGIPFAEWDGARPVEGDYMPDWPDEQRTHWQMYEDTSEGTPISPVMETPEVLARWLADNNASAFASETATYDQWLSTIKRGFACSAVMTVNKDGTGTMQSGVAALAESN